MMSLARASNPDLPDREFKGLVALLGGVEKALVDINTGLSMHSLSAKNHGLECAKEALSAALRDFRRGNGIALRDAGLE
jgi:hypothetical protein